MDTNTWRTVSRVGGLVALSAVVVAFWPWYHCVEQFPANGERLVTLGVLDAESLRLGQFNETSTQHMCWRAYPVHRQQGPLLFFALGLIGGVVGRGYSWKGEQEGKETPLLEVRPSHASLMAKEPSAPREIPDVIELDESLEFMAVGGLEEPSAPSLMQQVKHVIEYQQRENVVVDDSEVISSATPDGFFCPPGYDGTSRLYVDPDSANASDRFLPEPERVNLQESPFLTLRAALEYAQTLVKKHQRPVQVRVQPGVYQTSFLVPSRVAVVNHRMPAGLDLEGHTKWLLSQQSLDHQDRVTILAPADAQAAVTVEAGGLLQGLYGLHLAGRDGVEQCGMYAKHAIGLTVMSCVMEEFRAGGARFELCGRDDMLTRLLGSIFRHNVGVEGGGVCVKDSVVRVERCLFQENKAFRGGGLYADRLPAPMHVGRTEFRDNKAQTQSRPTNLGAIKLESYATYEGLGGGLLVQHGAVKLDGCHLAGNGASVGGGGMCLVAGRGIVSGEGSTMRANKARWGGALMVVGWSGGDASCKIQDVEMEGNAGLNGGGAGCLLGQVTTQIESSELERNVSAHGEGAGMYVAMGAALIVSGVTFRGNKAGSHGGGLAVRNGMLRVKGQCVFQDNEAREGAAGGVFFESVQEPGLEQWLLQQVVKSPLVCRVVEAEFVGNIASKGATAIFVGSMEHETSVPVTVESEDSLLFRGNRFSGRDGEDNPVLVVWGGERIQAGRRLARGTTTLT